MEAANPRARLYCIVVFVLVGSRLLVACDSGESPSGLPEESATTVSETRTCLRAEEGVRLPADYRARGRVLVGDVDGDGRSDRVTLRESVDRPKACRRALVVEVASGDPTFALVKPLGWPSPDPKLLLLADIDGQPGSEPVVALSPGAVFRPGAVFTISNGDLVRMRLLGKASGTNPDLFPFYDEFPAGVDCTRIPGQIVVTVSQFAPRGDDSAFGITRTFYRADGASFRPVSRDESVVDCCNGEAQKRWPETADDPFRSCR